jgi:cyclopropane fatty-acyl-phospholipid synthase-like methyltransferase
MKKFQKFLTESTREKYYEEQHQLWVDTPYQKSPVAVGWLDGKQNQAKRFETLLNIGVQEGDSILDLGCGLGHMVEHLEKIGLNVRYTGIDTSKKSIQQAYQFREATYIHGTIFDIQDRYDWGLASGVFNVEFPKLEMLETISELLSKANKGVAFNLLSNSANNNLTYENYIPKEIISHLKGDISIVENYGVENDFTIYIKKN